MTTTNALSAAMSSLRVIERQMSAASANIANADVVGYTKKTVTVTTRAVSGESTGVTATGLTSKIDAALQRQIIAAATEDGNAGTATSYYQSLNTLLGSLSSSTSSGTDLSSLISSLQSDLSDLATTPESATLKSLVVSDLDAVASALRDTSAGVQDLRSKADTAISSTIDEVNTTLQTIADLNTQIATAKSAGRSTADLEDTRMQALQTVAADIGVTYYVDSSGMMKVYTASGQTLLDSNVHKLSHTAAASVSASVTYDGTASSGLDGISLDGTDITSQITSGILGALIAQRDKVLTAVQSSLDNLASTLGNALNDIYNEGSGTTSPNTLTGTASVVGADSLSGSGTVRIAVVDSTGAVTNYQDLTLDNYATVDDLVSALNGISGLTAAVTSDGHLSITANDSTAGIAINTMTSAVGAAGEGFSGYFGLNDVLTDSSSAATISVRPDLLKTPGLLAAGTLSDSGTLTAGDTAVTSGSATIATALSSALTGNKFFVAAGVLSATKTSFADYAGAIISAVGASATTASTTATVKSTTLTALESSFSSKSGVNVDEETATIASLQNSYAASAKVISAIQEMFKDLLAAVQA